MKAEAALFGLRSVRCRRSMSEPSRRRTDVNRAEDEGLPHRLFDESVPPGGELVAVDDDASGPRRQDRQRDGCFPGRRPEGGPPGRGSARSDGESTAAVAMTGTTSMARLLLGQIPGWSVR